MNIPWLLLFYSLRWMLTPVHLSPFAPSFFVIQEHEAFLQGLRLYGREWKRVAADIRTRTSAQIRSHAQKYFAKLAKSR